MIRSRVACLAAALFLFAAGHAAAEAFPDPLKLYGSDIAFAVWRKGTQIGEHRVTFARQDDVLTVRSILDLAVKFLGLTVYTFHYTCQEIWRDNKLDALTSTIDDNGTKTAVNAKDEGGALAVTGPDAHERIAHSILPSSHWDAQVIDATRVLNTLSGKISEVKLEPLGVESVAVGSTTRPATHYRYVSDFKAESWYDAGGHWLKLRFPGKDGTPIDYVCERCVAPQ
ncbi:MAG TPA: DUF6134 family protein [Stellaceae bacterium]|nr:DUF6134 family protein [Stellaceae bacterium]